MTGCSIKQEPQIEVLEKIVEVKRTIPNELLICNSLDVNVSNIKTQADVSRLLIYITEEHDICKSNIDAIKIWNEKNK